MCLQQSWKAVMSPGPSQLPPGLVRQSITFRSGAENLFEIPSRREIPAQNTLFFVIFSFFLERQFMDRRWAQAILQIQLLPHFPQILVILVYPERELRHLWHLRHLINKFNSLCCISRQIEMLVNVFNRFVSVDEDEPENHPSVLLIFSSFDFSPWIHYE